LEQQVTVIAVEGQHAIVSGRRASACGDCAGKASCATMGSWVERIIELRVPNDIHAKVGDRVLLAVPDHVLLRIAFGLYAVPMAAFVAVGLATRSLALYFGWPGVEALAGLGGIAAVLAYYFWYKSRLKGNSNNAGLDVHMVRVLDNSKEHSVDHMLVSSH